MRSSVQLICALLLSASSAAIAQELNPQFNESASFQDTAANDQLGDWTSNRMTGAELAELPVDNGELDIVRQLAPPQAEARGLGNSSDEESSFVTQSSGDYRSIPLRYSGKLFFTKNNGRDSVCSGQFIAPRVVLTAAHCVRDRDTGAWYKNFRFALQYHQGDYSRQYGSLCVTTKAGWVKKRPSDSVARHLDYAMILVKEDSPTGYFGWSFGWRGTYASAVKIGYPVELERGRVVQVERGPLFFPRDRPGVVAIRHANPKSGGGSSGGAFVGNYSYTGGPGTNRVISVTSASYGKDPNVDIGPYFDSGFETMLRHVAGGCR